MTDFNKYADLAQTSIDYFYQAASKEQFMNNVYPLRDEKENETFQLLVDRAFSGYTH